MKVALVHYWLVGMRGGEKVLEVLCDMYPQADIYTLVADLDKLSPTILKHKIYTSFLQKIGGRKHYQKMLLLMPHALESFDLTPYDLIISSEAGPAKGIVPRPDALHICYCHSPMRYIWDLYPQYYANAGKLTRLLMSLVTPWIRTWDVSTAARVDHFIANSSYVAKRIEKFYRRESTVINPPVATESFSAAETASDYYLCAGQITPYKKIEIAVAACTALNRPLVVIGSGVTKSLRKLAGPTVRFLGAVSNDEMTEHFRACRALIFPGVEDFGIVPLEVMASGRPVIAFARGGATETVIEGKTGLFFYEQTVNAVIEAILKFEDCADSFDTGIMQAHAAGYRTAVFRERLTNFIDNVLNVTR
jgi:glycosyltransferase involved in cell wall biosynthesis